MPPRNGMRMASLSCLQGDLANPIRCKSGTRCGVQTCAEMTGQVFCTLEASGAMAARVGESVHMVCLVSIMLWRRLEVCWSRVAGAYGSYPLHRSGT